MAQSSRITRVKIRSREALSVVARVLTPLLALVVSVALTACASSADQVRVDDTPMLAGHSVDEWCALLEPAPESRAWQDIPWQTNLHDGLAAAAEAKRPLLLWLMNGHPLGCT